MAREHIAAGIDVGSSAVRILVAQAPATAPRQGGEVTPDELLPTVLGSASLPMEGVQKGVISDLDAAVRSLGVALDRAERIAGVPIEHAYVSITGSHISSQNSRGVIAVSRADSEITAEDVTRVINAAQAISLPNNREILHVLPQDFIVDGQEHISDPVGMTGIRLEVETHIIDGATPFIKNITKALNQSGVHVEDFVFAPLAAATAVLDKKQRELGAVLVDIGASMTSLVVYEENRLLHTATLPVASGHVTNDIAIGLRTSIEVAETIKREHGTALTDTVKQNESILVEADEGAEELSVSRREVASIIRDRVDELFSFVDKELSTIKRSGLLPAGIIFTGHGSMLPGMVEMAKQKLRLPARHGVIQGLNGLTDESEEPAYAVAAGLVLWAFEHERQASGARMGLRMPQVGQSVQSLRSWLRTFLP